LRCPICDRNHPLRKHGTYSRGIRDFELGHIEIEVLRYFCPGCGGTVSYLPDFAVPHKYYSSFVISVCLYLLLSCESGICDVAGRFSMHQSLLRYWVKQWWFNRVNMITVLRDHFGIAVPEVKVGSHVRSRYITDESLCAFLCACELVFGGELESCRGNCAAGFADCEDSPCSVFLQRLQKCFLKLSFPMSVF